MTKVCYTDIGANLCNTAFADDCSAVIERARQAGIQKILITSGDLEEAKNASLLCSEYPGLLFATIGVHPHQARSVNAGFTKKFAPYLARPEFRAIGETGLDYNRNYSPPSKQEKVFEEQLELAAEIGLPVFLHERDTGRRFYEILRAEFSHIVGGVLHCFTGDSSALHSYLDLGLYIGITGWICDPKRGALLRNTVRQIPDDRLLVETDAPFLPPKTLKPVPRRNEPVWLVEVVRTLAACRQQKPSVVATLSHDNAERLFAFKTAQPACSMSS